MEFTLLWAALTGVAGAWAGIRLWPTGLPDHPLDRMIGSAAAGLLVGRVMAMIAQGVNPLLNPVEVVMVRGGIHVGAAVVGTIASFLVSVRGRIRYLDAVAPAALTGLAGWHAGCLWRDACLGVATDLPWGWAAAASPITRHPVEIYAVLGLVAAAWIVSRLPARPLLRSGTALALAGLVRLATEPLRLTIAGGPIGWYGAAIVLGLAVALAGPPLTRRFDPGRLESAPVVNETSAGGPADSP